MIGIFGGTFDPVHEGHVAIVKAAFKELKCEKVFVIPAGIPPHKTGLMFTNEQRFDMTKTAFASVKNVEISDYEILKDSPSYTVETLKYFRKKFPKEKLVLLLGSDSFVHLQKWHRYEDIKDYASLGVAKRIGDDAKVLKATVDELKDEGFQLILLKAKIPDLSSTAIRKELLKNTPTHGMHQKPMESFVNLDVKKPRKTAPRSRTYDSKELKDLALLCAHAVIDKKAEHTMILNVGSTGISFTDYFIISSGASESQVQAMADEAVVQLKKSGYKPMVEGYEQGRWILVDAGGIVLHLFHADIRNFYNLEQLWTGAPRVEFLQNSTPLLLAKNNPCFMRITFLTATKFKESSYKELFEMYGARTGKYVEFQYKDLGATHKGKLDEDELLLKYLEGKKGSWVLVLLNERGKLLKSQDFAGQLRKWQDTSVQELIFAVGGAHEFGPIVQKKASMLWSLSPMIMAHELAAVAAMEQIYRAYTILAGHPYHNE